MSENPTKTKLDPELVQYLNKEILEDELITPDRMYFDWSLFRDPYLGAVISLLMTDVDQKKSAERFKRLQEQYTKYQTREFNDPAYYFPELKLKTSSILERLADPEYHEQVFYAAPFTMFIAVLAAQLKVNANHSQVNDKFTKVMVDKDKYHKNYDSIRLSINTYPLKLSKKHHDFIGAFFVGNYNVDVEILSTPPKDLPLDFLLSMDEIYTNNLTELLDNVEFSKALSEMKFLKKRLFAARHLGPKRPERIKQRAVDAEFLKIRGILDMLTRDFVWIQPNMMSYELYPPDPNTTE